MRIYLLFTLSVLFIACKKESQNITVNNTQATAVNDTSFIHVSVNDEKMLVKSIIFNRSSSSLYMAAQNDFQKVEVYTYNYYGSSGFNYQYTFYIDYSTRSNLLDEWLTRHATTTAEVSFECCDLPVKDNPIDGSFQATFPDFKNQIKVTGDFHLIF